MPETKASQFKCAGIIYTPSAMNSIDQQEIYSCLSCGALVLGENREFHLRWHMSLRADLLDLQKEQVISEPVKIAEDLLGRYIELTRWDKGPLNGMQMPWQCDLRTEAKLIERVSTAEASLTLAKEENEQLKATLDSRNSLLDKFNASNERLNMELARLKAPLSDEESK